MATDTKNTKTTKPQKIEKAEKTKVVWGSPDYLKLRFDDIDTATELTRKTKLGAEIRKLVKTVSTPKDNLAVYRTYRTVGTDADGVTAREGIVVQVSFGLNGTGDQADYFAALQRLVKTGRFYVFDAIVDACDDVADVLCRFRPEASQEKKADKTDKPANADHRKQRGRTAPNRAGKAPAKPEAK